MSKDILGVTVHDARGVVADFLEKLGGPNGQNWLLAFKRFLRKENPWQAPTSFTVISDGRTSEDFIRDLEEAQFRVSHWAKGAMHQSAFVSTNGQTYKVVVIKGEEFRDSERITSNIRAEAERREYLTPPAEVAPLLRELISDEELEQMGLYWLTVMHEPIAGSDGCPNLLSLARDGAGRWLTAYGPPAAEWARTRGFAFLAP